VDGDETGLVERCLAGDEEARIMLVDRHARMVGTVLWRATGDRQAIEDLAQDTFLRIFRALPGFDRRAKLSTWIYTIAHRVAIDHLRRRGRWADDERFAVGMDEHAPEEVQAPANERPDVTLVREEQVRAVRDALARLPDKYRLPLVYAAIDGLDYPTIAGMLGVTVGSVKTLVFRAKKLLKDELQNAV
jgi:RNA polymerase sigma-70 factor (ECF subfamily)